jgi:hypothetical protein
VDEALASHPIPDSGVIHQVDGAPLEDASTNPMLDVSATAVLDHEQSIPAR